MLERTILIIFIVGILLLTFQQDVAKMLTGQTGFAAKAIDWTGFLTKKQEPIVVKRTHQSSYKFDSSTNLRDLNEKYQKIDQERNRLINKRKEILGRLTSVNNQIYKEAQTYSDQFTKDFQDRALSGEWAKVNEDDMAKLMSISQTLGNEYNSLNAADDTNYEKLNESQRYLEIVSKELIKELMEISEEGVGRLSLLYQELQNDQDLLIENLKQEYERARERNNLKDALANSEAAFSDKQAYIKEQLRRLKEKERDMMRYRD